MAISARIYSLSANPGPVKLCGKVISNSTFPLGKCHKSLLMVWFIKLKTMAESAEQRPSRCVQICAENFRKGKEKFRKGKENFWWDFLLEKFLCPIMPTAPEKLMRYLYSLPENQLCRLRTRTTVLFRVLSTLVWLPWPIECSTKSILCQWIKRLH